MSRSSPKFGQIETLPGLEGIISPEELLHPRAFVTVTRPSQWGLVASDYEQITDRMVERADPESLALDLMPTTEKRRTVDYEKSDGTRVVVALNADEYKVILRSKNPRYLSQFVSAGAESGRLTLASSGAARARSDGARTDALKQKRERMQLFVDRPLAEEARILEAVHETAVNYWRGRGHNATLRMKINSVMLDSVANMLAVISHQRNWTPEQLELAHKSLERRLFFTHPDKDRMQEWDKLLRVLKRYNVSRTEAFKERIGRVDGYLQVEERKAKKAS